jgi:pyroglutamyl-peptidase
VPGPTIRRAAVPASLAVLLTAAATFWMLRPTTYPTPPAPVRTILVTGFGPFGSYETNPAWESIRMLHGAVIGRSRIRIERIDVVYDLAGPQLADAIQRTGADLVLSLGVAPGTEIRVETTARNRDTAPVPDNAGVLRQDEPIRPDGPDTVPTRLPVDALVAALRQAGYPVRTSDDAGGYLCNHLFYELLTRVPADRVAGFVHVPALEGPWDLERLRAAVRLLLETIDANAPVPATA